MKPTFFANPGAFRKWLEKNHATKSELLVGFYKRDSGKPSITWPESVDQALCFGWIDGVRRSIDEESYTIRFTPRRANSNWSAVNLKKVKELIASGLMQPAGLAVYEARNPAKEARYSFEQAAVKLDADAEKQFKKKPKAWTFFQQQPPGYRRVITHWITSAKRADARERRLSRVIELSARGERVNMVKPFS